MNNDTRLAFFDLTCLHKIHSFSLALSSEAIEIDELGSNVPTPHTYTTFFLLKFIFHKKITSGTWVWFRLFGLVYIQIYGLLVNYLFL